MIPAAAVVTSPLSFLGRCRTISDLSRVKLSVAVALSAVAGFVAVSHAISWGLLGTFAGVALLSAAASAFNQLQEMDLDAVMDRTRFRPLLTGCISRREALIFGIGAALAGFAVLYFRTTHAAALLGGFTLAWYCAVYTPLKRKTLFALPVGALTGALAPVIGCTAATGKISGPVVCLACFLFFWQVPHFLLMLFKYGREYEKAGFPYMSILTNEARFRSIVFVWCAAASVSSLAFPLFGLVSGVSLTTALVVANLFFIFYFYFKMARAAKIFSVNKAFRLMYMFQGCVLTLVIAQGILTGL
jgi:heme o synthase